MQTQSRPPSLALISSSSPARPISTSPSPHRQSQSPFRYIRFAEVSDNLDEKATPLSDIVISPERNSSSTSQAPPPQPAPGPSSRSQLSHPPRPHRSFHQHRPSPSTSHSHLLRPHASPFHLPQQSFQHGQSFNGPSPSYSRARALRATHTLRRWLPIILYTLTSLIFVVGIAFYRTELFELLDELAHWLQIDEQFGHAVLFCLIFLTTFPPIPLYSTLIILSGYTFGPWTGAIISYWAALLGAITVFILSRTFLRNCISGWLGSTPTIKRVVCAIEKRPKLLFLIRLAPYPYNVMNCLLAASPSLSLQTYTICTALSLFKVIIHTALGASIHSFKDYNSEDGENRADAVARLWTIAGILLCIAILIYLYTVARRAVDDELDDEPITSRDTEETRAFLAEDPEAAMMTETLFRTHQLTPYQMSMTNTTMGDR